jgi:hypothetical protein
MPKKIGEKKVKVEYTKGLFYLIALLLISFVIVIFLAYSDNKKNEKNVNATTLNVTDCEEDLDCIPATCCHPDSCIIKQKAPNCDDSICTMVCSGPLDCGAGSCRCINNKCQITPNLAE